MIELEIGKAKVITKTKQDDLVILNFGTFLAEAENAAKELNASVVDMRFVKPMDLALLDKVAAKYKTIVTIEDNAIAGGAGSGVNEYLNAKRFNNSVLNIGLPDQFIKHGTQEEIYQELMLDAKGLQQQIETFLAMS